MAHQKIDDIFKSPWYWRMPVVAGFFMVLFMIGQVNESVFLILNSVLYIPLESVWLIISAFGNAEVLAIMLLPLIGRRLDILWAVLISGSITFMSVGLAQNYFGLPRPPVILDFNQYHQIGETYSVNSFPSDHSAVVFSLAAIIILSVKQRWIKITIVCYASVISLSQIAIGAHWPIDIVAGALIGWLFATVGMRYAKAKIVHTMRAKKLLILFFISVGIYITFSLIDDYIEVALVKIFVLIVCFLAAYPDLKKIIKSKVKKAKKS